MIDLKKINGATQITSEDHVLNAHEFLKDFLDKFDTAKRGGIHDFIEIALFNMINSSIKNIDSYLGSGHKNVNANELISIFADSCQKILDNIKRNLEVMKDVELR